MFSEYCYETANDELTSEEMNVELRQERFPNIVSKQQLSS